MKKLTTSLLVAVSLLSAGVVMAQKNKKNNPKYKNHDDER